MSQPINIKYSLKEFKKKKEEKYLTYNELEEFIEQREKEITDEKKSLIKEEDCYSEIFFLLEEEYNINYTKKELEMIIEYYSLSKRKKKKVELIHDIIIFEQSPINEDIVEKRKLHWYYLEQLKNDDFLKQYIMAHK